MLACSPAGLLGVLFDLLPFRFASSAVAGALDPRRSRRAQPAHRRQARSQNLRLWPCGADGRPQHARQSLAAAACAVDGTRILPHAQMQPQVRCLELRGTFTCATVLSHLLPCSCCIASSLHRFVDLHFIASALSLYRFSLSNFLISHFSLHLFISFFSSLFIPSSLSFPLFYSLSLFFSLFLFLSFCLSVFLSFCLSPFLTFTPSRLTNAPSSRIR